MTKCECGRIGQMGMCILCGFAFIDCGCSGEPGQIIKCVECYMRHTLERGPLPPDNDLMKFHVNMVRQRLFYREYKRLFLKYSQKLSINRVCAQQEFTAVLFTLVIS